LGLEKHRVDLQSIILLSECIGWLWQWFTFSTSLQISFAWHHIWHTRCNKGFCCISK